MERLCDRFSSPRHLVPHDGVQHDQQLALVAQTRVERMDGGVVPDRRHGGHVEDSAHAGAPSPDTALAPELATVLVQGATPTREARMRDRHPDPRAGPVGVRGWRELG